MATRKTTRRSARTSPRKATRGTTSKSTPKAPRKAAKKSRAAAKPRRKAPTPRRQPETLRLRALSASLTCGDLDRSLAFYIGGLGFIVGEEWVRDGRRVGALLRAGRCELGLAQDDWALGRDRRKGEGVRLYLETAQDLDALATRLRTAGYSLTSEPKPSAWAARELSIDDPDGFHLTVFVPLPERD
jgi:catechol 2,3-dioxygenase-like lactoylglutathione lyase family enzyme